MVYTKYFSALKVYFLNRFPCFYIRTPPSPPSRLTAPTGRWTCSSITSESYYQCKLWLHLSFFSYQRCNRTERCSWTPCENVPRCFSAYIPTPSRTHSLLKSASRWASRPPCGAEGRHTSARAMDPRTSPSAGEKRSSSKAYKKQTHARLKQNNQTYIIIVTCYRCWLRRYLLFYPKLKANCFSVHESII